MLEFTEFGCGGGAELVAESLAELFVAAEGFGAVAAGGEDLPEQRVSMFADLSQALAGIRLPRGGPRGRGSRAAR